MTKISKRLCVVAFMLVLFMILPTLFKINKSYIVKAEVSEIGLKETEQTFNENELQKKNSNITIEDGLGLGINVITANNVRDFKTGYSILTQEARQTIPCSSTTNYESDFKQYSTVNANELITAFNSSIELNLSIDAFLCELGACYGTGSVYDFTGYNYRYYYSFYAWVYKETKYITDYANKDTYTNAFSQSFLNDLDSLQSGDITCETLFNRYGTHLIGSALYGGRLRANYFMASNNIKITNKVKEYINANVSFPDADTNMTANIVSNINAKMNTSYTTADVVTGYRVSVAGGDTFGSSDLANFNTSYSEWLNSFNPKNENDIVNCSLVDFTSEGLVPLWTILPTQYADLADDMMETFERLCAEQKDSFLDEFTSGNYTDFSGGMGTEEEPYIITEGEQINNIETVDMSAHYVLANDVDLSSSAQWYPVGGSYKQKAFSGTFDGNGYTINNLNRTATISEQNNRIYFGLFGYINGGTVKNIVFENVNIRFTGPAVNNSNTRVFIGVVAGKVNSGQISDITINSGYCSYYCETNGMSYVGSIAGLSRYATIRNCENNINLRSCRYAAVVGGIIGYDVGSIIMDCTNSGALSAYGTKWWGYAHAGGITGGYDKNHATSYINCTNTGSLTVGAYDSGPKITTSKGNQNGYTSTDNYM